METYIYGKISLTQRPYLAGTYDDPYYTARGEDETGGEYQVLWDILEEYNPADQEEDDTCDWGHPRLIRKL